VCELILVDPGRIEKNWKEETKNDLSLIKEFLSNPQRIQKFKEIGMI
tara:strand:+ start:528 stop:668 length:141 start_codon:yes stop_codon:yes gene_type:complete